jgi:DNA-binding NarL/FixJ family response regulator
MTRSAPWTVLIADDHPIVLRGLSGLIGNHGDFAVFGRVSNGEDALETIRNHRPDVAVLDVYMPKLGGIGVLAAVRKASLPTRIVLLTASFEDDHLLEAIELGADGILLKEAAPEELLDCLARVAAGGRWIAAGLAERGEDEAAAPAAATAPLTVREAELARLVVSGLTNKTIADRLDLTEGTVKSHLHNIYSKLRIANRTALAALFLGRRAARRQSR